MDRRILIVEDDISMQELLIAHISSRGEAGSIDCTGSVRESVEALGATPYDLIVLDLQLPDGDGLEVLEALRRHSDPQVAATPVAVFTSTSPSSASVTMESGRVSAFFNKTEIGLERLCDWVKDTLTAAGEGRLEVAVQRGPL